MEITEVINEQRIYAMIHNVPILRESEVRLFTDLIDMYKPHSILEVGTAIGYSTILMASRMAEDGKIVSMELNQERHEKAREFISKTEYKDRIELIQGDAGEKLKELDRKFDMVFLDGPKAQYLKQLELIMPHLEENAVILADNVMFRGYVESDEAPPKRYRTIVKRLREYLAFVRNKELFNTTIYKMGDGMSISVWKGGNEKRKNEEL